MQRGRMARAEEQSRRTKISFSADPHVSPGAPALHAARARCCDAYSIGRRALCVCGPAMRAAGIVSVPPADFNVTHFSRAAGLMLKSNAAENVFVEAIDEGSLAHQHGVKPGSIIVSLCGESSFGPYEQLTAVHRHELVD